MTVPGKGMAEWDTVSLRIPRDVKRRFQQKAAGERRTMQAMAAFLMEEWVGGRIQFLDRDARRLPATIKRGMKAQRARALAGGTGLVGQAMAGEGEE